MVITLLTLTRWVIIFFSITIFSFVSGAQSNDSSPNYKVGDRVEADYMGWYPGKIVEVLNNGDQYNVELYPPDGGKPFIYWFLKTRLRPYAGKMPVQEPLTAKLVIGKYGCTATQYVNGSYEYLTRGSFLITRNGRYTYNGFKKPSTGTYTSDKLGNLFFKGGYLDGGKAEKIDRPNKFFLVFPANPDHRWTCGLIEKK